LAQQLKGLDGLVQVIIGDNASTDETPEVTQAFLLKYPSTQVLRHCANLGADENFCRCFDQVSTRFFWIIGDDDLPKHGVVEAVLSFLEKEGADLLYLNSEWGMDICKEKQNEHITNFPVRTKSREAFAQEVNVWVTFISGLVVNRERLFELNPGLDIRRFSGTCLVQLGWVLPLLMTGSAFKICRQRCVLATSENSGGYGLFKVFGSNFPTILNVVCGPDSRVNHVINNRLRWVYIHRLIKGVRFVKMSTFQVEEILVDLVIFKGSLAYRVGMRPLTQLPRRWALLLYAVLMFPTFASRLVTKLSGARHAI
jgi:glycosyltransferase involved in cell wall biosynthesis